jgi:TPR repeat protein
MKPFVVLILICLKGTIANCAELTAISSDWRQLWDRSLRAQWYSKPVADLRKQADAGQGVAMWILADRSSFETNYVQAAEWRHKAAQAGLAQAVLNEVRLESDLAAALQQLEKIVASGYPEAKVALARALLSSAIDAKQFYNKPNPGRAVELLQEAVAEGSVGACIELATLYACGVGEPRNDGERPAALWEKAAEAGNGDAMKELARRYRLGFSVEKDLLLAGAWAAREAHTKTSLIIESGPIESMEWAGLRARGDDSAWRRISTLFDEALAKGSGAAFLELASLHAEGNYGKPNLPRATALYVLAERFGNSSAAAKRGELESKLDEQGRARLKADLTWMTPRAR